MKLGAYLFWTPVAVATGWIVLLGYLLNDAVRDDHVLGLLLQSPEIAINGT